MFEAVLCDVDSLSQTNLFFDSAIVLIAEYSRMASQRQCRHEGPSMRLKSTLKVFLQVLGAVYILMAEGEKSRGKAFPLVGFLSYLDSRSNQTQAVFGKKIGLQLTSLNGGLQGDHRETDTLTSASHTD